MIPMQTLVFWMNHGIICHGRVFATCVYQGDVTHYVVEESPGQRTQLDARFVFQTPIEALIQELGMVNTEIERLEGLRSLYNQTISSMQEFSS